MCIYNTNIYKRKTSSYLIQVHININGAIRDIKVHISLEFLPFHVFPLTIVNKEQDLLTSLTAAKAHRQQNE